MQIHNSYLVVESEDGLLIIDQHALHERILYEQLRRRTADQPLETQRLLLPDVVRVPADRIEALEEHAELLDLCRIAASRGGWNGDQFDPWREAVPLLERQMHEAQSSLDSLASVVEGLRLVLRIESSEVNKLFSGVVAASDSGFVRAMHAFRDAARTHIAYVCQQIPALEPSLAPESQALREQYPYTVA